MPEISWHPTKTMNHKKVLSTEAFTEQTDVGASTL